MKTSYLLGGLAVAGVGAYFLLRKPAATGAGATGPMTQAEGDACKAAMAAMPEADRQAAGIALVMAMSKVDAGDVQGGMADMKAYAASIQAKYPQVASCYVRMADLFPVAAAAAKNQRTPIFPHEEEGRIGERFAELIKRYKAEKPKEM